MQQMSPVYFNGVEIADAANWYLLLWRYKMDIYQTLED